jgi:hypothetical protein
MSTVSVVLGIPVVMVNVVGGLDRRGRDTTVPVVPKP